MSANTCLLAKSWNLEDDPTGWWVSEKLDGVRALWDGKCLRSRVGNVFPAPDWFTKLLPRDATLDGELWIARGAFQTTVSVVKSGSRDKGWGRIFYCVFDMPDEPGRFEKRQAELAGLVVQIESRSRQVRHVQQTKCGGRKELALLLDGVLKLGAEGLMLREPGSLYAFTRSSTLRKLKRFFDEEALVIGYDPGAGKHEGRLGALKCRDKTGALFKVGTGFSDAEREKPPAIGTTITFRFQERTESGTPRFPSFVTARDYE